MAHYYRSDVFLRVGVMVEVRPMQSLFVLFYFIVVVILGGETCTSMLISASRP